jgi:hypothetical protein
MTKRSMLEKEDVATFYDDASIYVNNWRQHALILAVDMEYEWHHWKEQTLRTEILA